MRTYILGHLRLEALGLASMIPRRCRDYNGMQVWVQDWDGLESSSCYAFGCAIHRDLDYLPVHVELGDNT